MKRNHIIIVLACLIVMAGCGKKSEVADKGPQSFSMTQSNQASGTDNQSKATQGDAGGSASNSASSSPSPSGTNKAEGQKPAPETPAVPEASPAAAQTAPVQTSPAAVEKTPTVNGKSPAAPSNAPSVPDDKTAPASKEAAPVNPAPAVKETAAPEVKPEKKNAAAATNSNEIAWSEFFDNNQQTTPSNKFWDLNGKTVQIKGFMGEVLSFEKHWFLIIPQPGAECPFDNGDESYWNKIMIAFVPDDTKLRYTSGPLKITGRLDVGIKLDQSGYKTMFRLYDAHFEKIKE